MGTVFAPYNKSSAEQQISLYYNQQMKNQAAGAKKNINSHRFISSSKPNENLVPLNNNIHGAGLIFAPPPPPPLYYSCPPSLSVFNNNFQRQEPPLLPLPISRPYKSLPSGIHNNNNINNSLSRVREFNSQLEPTNQRKNNIVPRKTNNSKWPSTPKKTKQQAKRSEITKQNSNASSLIVASAEPVGPDPDDLPKDVVAKVLSPTSSLSDAGNIGFSASVPAVKDLDRFSGSIFTLSPPPSSLPFPKFSIRPKLSCTAEAAGVDTGATDNLRRILRLP